VTDAPAAALRMTEVVAGYYAHDLVLDHVSLAARAGRVTAVLGPNGSGKSTALRILAGFLSPRSGRVLLGDRDITDQPAHQRISLGLGFLPQGRSVFPSLTVEENLLVGAWHLRRDRRRLRGSIEATYQRYPTIAPLRRRRAGSLSGGQQRMLEIARLLITDPAVMLIDEPSAGLSPLLADVAYGEIERFRTEGRTILLVDQNIRAAVELADDVYVLAFGRNESSGPRSQYADLDRLVREWLRAG
jgi:branched-chain amino acid transport system ATP-binding protein